MPLVAVYGTLRRGMGNHHLLGGCTLLWEGWIRVPYQMYASGFPALVPCADERRIYVEVYRVDSATMERLDGLEGYPWYYTRVAVDTPAGRAWLYVITRRDLVRRIQRDWTPVEGGDYTRSVE